MRAVSLHALERLAQRTGSKHLAGHLKKRWYLQDGTTTVKGITYVVVGGGISDCISTQEVEAAEDVCANGAGSP